MEWRAPLALTAIGAHPDRAMLHSLTMERMCHGVANAPLVVVAPAHSLPVEDALRPVVRVQTDGSHETISLGLNRVVKFLISNYVHNASLATSATTG